MWDNVPKALSAVSRPQQILNERQCSRGRFCAGPEAQRWRTHGSHSHLRPVHLSQTKSSGGTDASHPPRDPLWPQIQWRRTLGLASLDSYPCSLVFPLSPLFSLIEFIYRTVLDWQKIGQRVHGAASRPTVSHLLTSYISVPHSLQRMTEYQYIIIDQSPWFPQISLMTTKCTFYVPGCHTTLVIMSS